MQRNFLSRRQNFQLAALVFAAASSGALGFALSPTLAEPANSTQTAQSADANGNEEQNASDAAQSVAPLVFFDAKTPLDALTPQGVELRRL
ncbi:MAG: hypothetical protein IJE97_09840, partial [Thermoguttaceae bacterium]|nr:hypothetical protein [Thermoguttaceae bacterium]